MTFINNLNSCKPTKRYKGENKIICSLNEKHMERFTNYISGAWTNSKQAEEFPALWSKINVSYSKLPQELLDGESFYVESAYHYMLDQPYKTGVVLLKLKDDIIEMKNYKIIQPEDFWYGSYNKNLLKSMKSDRLVELPDYCNTVFSYCDKEDIFNGRTKPGKKCIIPRNGLKTYLDSRITLEKDSYSSWDIGRNLSNDEQIWGATTGAFRFKKIEENSN
mmetsp:Transcript_42502/g.66567  ORF Transcript_42502/g.66567 Transcript_42502/m.66567 type:complete len:220 (-) Transcript_42502:3940-4599(-)